MNNIWTIALSVVGGAIIGAGATYYYMKKKENGYVEALEEENKALEAYVDSLEKEMDIGQKKEDELMTEFHEELNRLTKMYNYNSDDIPEEERDLEEDEDNDILEEVPVVTHKYPKADELPPLKNPRLIPEDDFGMEDDYEAVSYTMYADGVILDDNDVRLDDDDVNEVLGMRNLLDMGKDGNYTRYIRNDDTKTDYEVVYDFREFDDHSDYDE